MDIIAYRLRKLREEKNMSQREVAEHIGITREAYNQYENGVSKPVRRLDQLSALFNVSVDYILGKDKTTFESTIIDVDEQIQSQVKKYLNLSDVGKNIVNITLDAVYEKERKSELNI